jgi:alanine racemase
MAQAEVRIELDAISANVAFLRTVARGHVMAVVKADGYGHGVVPAALAALDGGAEWLGVATVDEALRLRRAGVTAPLLCWLHAPGEPLRDAIAAGIDVSVATPEALAEAVAAPERARVHLKVDTGLSRGGATRTQWPELVGLAAKAHAAGTTDIIGVWSHLACADEPGHPSVDAQLAAYRVALAVAADAGLSPEVRHLANSAALLTRPDTHFELARAGLACYGLSPVPGFPELRPAMTVTTRVAQVKRVPAGSGVSYGHTYTTQRETTLALVPLGYFDGVPRHASGRAPVRVAGVTRRIAGRVCMDQFVVDCGDDPVRPGDEVVLFGPGDDGGPTADDWATACDTINYEIITRIGGVRAPRVYGSSHGV